MLAALCSCQTLAVLSTSQSSLAEGSRPRERVLPRPLSLPTQREACKGGKLRRARKLDGEVSPQPPGHTPVLCRNRALGLWAVRLDRFQQHVTVVYILPDGLLERKATAMGCWSCVEDNGK